MVSCSQRGVASEEGRGCPRDNCCRHDTGSLTEREGGRGEGGEKGGVGSIILC